MTDRDLEAARLHQRVVLAAFERPAARHTGRCESCNGSCTGECATCECLEHVQPGEPPARTRVPGR